MPSLCEVPIAAPFTHQSLDCSDSERRRGWMGAAAAPHRGPGTVLDEKLGALDAPGAAYVPNFSPGAAELRLRGGCGSCGLHAESERRAVGILGRRLVPPTLQQLAQGETRAEAGVGVGRRH